MEQKISSISFKSNIKLISQKDFAEKIKPLNKELHKVDYPWTPDTIKSGKNLFTVEIGNCIAGCVIDDKTATMFHQAHWDVETAKEYSQKAFNPEEFEQNLLKNLDLTCKKIHGFIFGGIKAQEKKEIWLFNAIEKIFKKNKIPYTEITSRKETKYHGRYSLLYENDSDTLYITTTSFNTRVSDSPNKEVRIEDGVVIYNYREKNNDSYGLKTCKGTAKDFLKSQFYNTTLSKFDKII